MVRVCAALIIVFLAMQAVAEDATQELNVAANVLRNMTASHQIPESVLAGTECVTVFPAIAQGAIVVGAKYGQGVVSCRTSAGWSAPAFLTVAGASVGAQAGFEHQDLVLLMNKEGEQELGRGEWSMDAKAVADGPHKVATSGPQDSDWKTPVLAYSSTSGEYAGASLGGSKISTDTGKMQDQYGANTSLQSVLNGEVRPPASAQAFLAALEQVSGKQ